MVSDPIADLLARIKNAYLVNKKSLTVPYSKIKENLVKILIKEGYLHQLEIKPFPGSKKIKTIKIFLKYKEKKPVLTKIKRVSKLGVKIYVKKDKTPRVLSGLGVSILSTSQGLMTGKEARKKGLGGEVICEVW